jgi:secreted trypsin-like serine protease
MRQSNLATQQEKNIMMDMSRKILITALGLCLAVTSLHASAQQRIVGGSFAPNGSYPWMAALLNSGGAQLCGGALIASKWVLTAASCGNSAVSVRVGSVDKASGGKVIRIVRKIDHPNYNRQIFEGPNDIALLELASPVSGITPIARSSARPASGSPVRLLGWGETSLGGGVNFSRFLKLLDTTVLSNNTCNHNMSTKDLCIKGTPTATACDGDNGGPALNGGRLAGVSSRSGRYKAPYCGEDYIYTNVSDYNTWINNTAR